MVKAQIVERYAPAGDVRRIHVDEIKLSGHLDRVEVQRAVLEAVVEHGAVSLRHEGPKPIAEGFVPCGLVSERALNLCEANVKVLAVEEVVGTFDDAGLTQGEEGNGELVRVAKLPNVGDSLINPGIFFVGELDVAESILHETRIYDVGVPLQDPLNLFGTEADQAILNQCQPEVIIEAEHVIVRDMLACLF